MSTGPSGARVKSVDGRESSVFAGQHHARFIDPDVPLHVISRVFQGRHLLRPSAELNSLIAGVIGRAQHLYADVRLYAVAFLSNHVHFMLQGPANQVPAFIGFIKREVSRRWGGRPEIDWPGAMWHEYIATALPTAESQTRCLKYVLSQGTKEGLVRRPQDWPGVHCARHLLSDEPLTGSWLNATAHARAVDAERRRRTPRPLHKGDFLTTYTVQFATIPAWRHLDVAARRGAVKQLVEEIELEGKAARAGRPPLGVTAVRRVPLARRTDLAPQPWFEHRRRTICWSNLSAVETRAYLTQYWDFQWHFRAATRATEHARAVAAAFPPGAFAPGRFSPMPEKAAA